jgi:hypothetical protein
MQSQYFIILAMVSYSSHKLSTASIVGLRLLAPRKAAPVDENLALHATLGVTAEQYESHILEGKCLGDMS